MTEFDIMMLGPSGIGKTSILATMYNELKANADGIFSVNSMDSSKTRVLCEKLELLQSQILDCKPSRIMENYVSGTEGIDRYPFGVTLPNEKNPRCCLNFFDHRGGIIKENSESADHKKLKSILNSAHVVINPVDACVLTEMPLLHEKYSNPFRVAELLNEAFSDDQKQLLIIALTKCETYMKDEQSFDKMIKNLKEYHKRVIKVVDEVNMKRGNNNILCVIVPVKTIGGVKFKRCEKVADEAGNNAYSFVFGRDGELGFKPENADFIFYLAVSFLLRQAYLSRGMFESLFDILGGKAKFISAVNAAIDKVNRYITSRAKHIEVIGNSSLLDKVS